MSESIVEPCVWPISPDPCCAGNSPEPDPAVVEDAILIASDIMRSLSGQMIGQCHQTLRPLHQCATCREHCCGGADGIALSGWDGEHVSEVLSVTIGPEVVDPATYWFSEQDQMLWRIPPDRWPYKDARWQPCGTGEAFCIEALTGVAPDAWALRVADMLACELIKACTGQKCRIPSNATTVTAQGVTVQLDPNAYLKLLPEVASWAAMVNPLGANLPAQVWSPDTDQGKTKLMTPGRRPWWR